MQKESCLLRVRNCIVDDFVCRHFSIFFFRKFYFAYTLFFYALIDIALFAVALASKLENLWLIGLVQGKSRTWIIFCSVF